MNCIKRLGERVMSKTFERQVNGLHIRSAILNRFTELGRPRTVAVSGVRGQGCSADRQTQPRPYLPMGDGLEAAQWLAKGRRGVSQQKCTHPVGAHDTGAYLRSSPYQRTPQATRLCRCLRQALQHARREIKDAMNRSDQQQARSLVAL